MSVRSLFTWPVVFVLANTLVLASLYFLVVPFLELVELKAWDLHFKQRGVIEPSGLVAYVTIDEQSVNRDGRWPWPRRQMAQLLEAVESHGARVIGLDMGFFEPDLKLRQRAILDVRERLREDARLAALADAGFELEAMAQQEDDDLILAETLKRLSVPLVLGHFFYFDRTAYFPPSPPSDLLDKAQCPIVRMVKEPPPGRLNDSVGIEVNIPVVEQASRYMGSFNVFADPDGSVRWMPLVIRYENRLFPSLALQMLMAAFEGMPLIVTADEQGIREIRLGPVAIPTNNKGELLLNYYGPDHTFPLYSASALLHGEAPGDCLKDRLVVIGNTTMGLHDMRPTPFSPVFPGVELHCTVMENMLQQHFLQRSERSVPFYDLLTLLILAFVFILLQSFLKGAPLAVSVVVLLGGYIGMTHYCFLRPGIWLNHLYPSLNLMIPYIGTSVHRYLKEEQEKRKIRQTFSLYVHRSIVDEMLAHPERLRIGGEKRELTVLFSDIRGFTTLSEQLPPEELVPQLNQYLTRMAQVVFDHHGTLDKFIGDAVMAFFGAPVDQPDHPYRACSTALEMIRTLGSLQQDWQKQGKSVLKIGIGINSGLMMVGNMGSESRFDYTVLGDNVNLTSRLEGLTKIYGVPIVVSESTWRAVKDEFVGRALDVVRVKGRQEPVTIFQLLGRKEEIAGLAEPLGQYELAMRQYRQRNWQDALKSFGNVETHWPGDPPSILYQERCRNLLEHDPANEWTFVTALDHK